MKSAAGSKLSVLSNESDCATWRAWVASSLLENVFRLTALGESGNYRPADRCVPLAHPVLQPWAKAFTKPIVPVHKMTQAAQKVGLVYAEGIINFGSG